MSNMLDTLSASLSSFGNISWGRLTFLVLCLFGIVAFYEIYTKAFALSRLEKEIELLQELSSIRRESHLESGVTEQATYDSLSSVLAEHSGSHRIPSYISLWLRRISFAALPWLLLAFVFLFLPPEARYQAMGGLVVISIPTIALQTQI